MTDHPTPPPTRGLDEAALREAYQAHSGELYGFCLNRIGDAQASQDAVQETFLRMWRAADRYDPALAGVRTWLYAIARNVIVDHFRRRKTAAGQVAFLEDLEDAVDLTTRDVGEGRLDVMVVEEALRRISVEHRQVIAEIYLKDRPATEVSQELGLPAGTIRSRLYYGLKALRAELDQMGVTR